MARVRYLLLTMLIWVFILGWWAGLVLWVAATGAWPMGSVSSIAWPLWMPVLTMPAIMAYLSWEYLWDQEKHRSFRLQNPQIRREKLRAKKKLQEPSTLRTPASDPTPAAPAIPTRVPCAAPRTASAILRCSRSTRPPSIEGEGEFPDDFEEALRQLMNLDQRR